MSTCVVAPTAAIQSWGFISTMTLRTRLPDLPTGQAGKIQIGAQDCFWEEDGAFTGEVSPRMLKNIGCSYAILGHSERKKYLGETLEMINKKVLETLKAQLIPIVCIGENIEEEMEAVLRGIENLKLKIKNLVLVYEPEWAISTSTEHARLPARQAREAMQKMRNILGEKFDSETAQKTSILYGGSVNSNNIQGFLKEGGAQGALVGAFSLDANEFIKLIHGAIL